MRARFVSLGTLLVVAGSGLAFWFARELPGTFPGSADKTEILMRNLSWGTNLENFTPYRKNDDLEFVFIAESENGSEANIDISKISEKLDISEILVNDVPTPANSLEGIRFDTALKVTVRGKAKEAVLIQEPLG